MCIGDRIKKTRVERGLTQAELAKLSGIHPVSIRKYETHKMKPQVPQIEKLAVALKVTPEYLIWGK